MDGTKGLHGDRGWQSGYSTRPSLPGRLAHRRSARVAAGQVAFVYGAQGGVPVPKANGRQWRGFDGLVTRSLMYNRRIVNPPCKEAEGGELFERGLLVNLGGVVRRSVSNSEEASTTK